MIQSKFNEYGREGAVTKVAALFTGGGGKGHMGNTATFLSPAGKYSHIRNLAPWGRQEDRMDRKHQMEIIAGYYSSLRDFRKNDTYSREHQTVYTAPDNAHWLVLEWKDKSTVQARLTAENGTVTAWDGYRVNNGDIRLTEAVRRAEKGGKQVTFTADEIGLLNQFADEGKTETLALMRKVIPTVKNTQVRGLLQSTADKLEQLSAETCGEFLTTTRKRCTLENERSIRFQLARVKAQAVERKQDEGYRSMKGRGRDEVI